MIFYPSATGQTSRNALTRIPQALFYSTDNMNIQGEYKQKRGKPNHAELHLFHLIRWTVWPSTHRHQKTTRNLTRDGFMHRTYPCPFPIRPFDRRRQTAPTKKSSKQDPQAYTQPQDPTITKTTIPIFPSYVKPLGTKKRKIRPPSATTTDSGQKPCSPLPFYGYLPSS